MTKRARWTPLSTFQLRMDLPKVRPRKKPPALTEKDFRRLMELAGIGMDQLYSEKEYNDARRLLGRMRIYHEYLKGE